MTDTTTTPEEELEQLEQVAIDGGAVSAGQLSEAREKVTLAGLARRGVEKRQAEKAAKDFTTAQAKAKKDAAALLSSHTEANVLDAYSGVVTSLGTLREAVGAYNALQVQVQEMFASVELPSYFANADYQADDFDARNHAAFFESPDPASARPPAAPYMVVVDGVTHSIGSVATYARIATSRTTEIPAAVSAPAILTRVEK